MISGSTIASTRRAEARSVREPSQQTHGRAQDSEPGGAVPAFAREGQGGPHPNSRCGRRPYHQLLAGRDKEAGDLRQVTTDPVRSGAQRTRNGACPRNEGSARPGGERA